MEKRVKYDKRDGKIAKSTKPLTKPKSIVIVTAQGNKRVKVPDEIEFEKLDDFKAYATLKWEYDHMDKKFAASNGKIYPLPIRNLSGILKLFPKREQERLKERDLEVRQAGGRLFNARTKAFGAYKKRETNALFNEYSTEIIEKLGKGWTCVDVHADMLKRGVDLSLVQLREFQYKNREKILELRNAWNNDTGDISLSVKKSRLEKLQYLLNEILLDFDKTTTPMLRTTLSKEARGIIDQARKEVEGEELKLTIDGKIDVEATIAAVMNSNQMLLGLTINQIIISRVAARLRLSSQWMIDRLAHSYYAKYNGYRRNDDLNSKPIYPTSVVYDILDDNMAMKNAEWEKTQMSYQLPPEEQTTMEQMEEEREMIKQRLKEKLQIKKA